MPTLSGLPVPAGKHADPADESVSGATGREGLQQAERSSLSDVIRPPHGT